MSTLQSIQRAVDVLEFVSIQPRTQSEVAAHLDVHRSTALRILQTLTDCGLTRRREENKYSLGYRLAGLANLALEQFEIVNIAKPHLVELGESCTHTIHLAALQNDSIVYIDKIEQPGMVRMFSQIGRPVVLHTSGVGKAIMAYLPAATVARMLEATDFARYTENTILSEEAFTAQLETVRRNGWAVDDAEFEDYINCVSMPIRDATGEVVAAVSITALTARADMAALETLLPRLREVTTEISKELGWRPQMSGSTQRLLQAP